MTIFFSLLPSVHPPSHLQIAGYVSPGQDAGGRGEEYREHGEEVVLHALEVAVVGAQVAL